METNSRKSGPVYPEGSVDLVAFVLDAVLLDGGDVNAGETIEVRLPPTWDYSLQDLPGYDQESRMLRLTTDMATSKDLNGKSVGYLGRAHPLVRRALDRVRNISFGGVAEQTQSSLACSSRLCDHLLESWF